MKIKDLVKMASENLLRRKLRTGLTILSIVIGTISIILMIALGDGMQAAIKKGFDSYGSVDVLIVSKGNKETSTSRFLGADTLIGLTDKDVFTLEGMDNVKTVAPILSAQVTIRTSQYYNEVLMVGCDPFQMEVMGYKTKEGRLLQDNVHLEAVFGGKALERFRKIPSDNTNAVIQRPDVIEIIEEEPEGITIDFGGGTAEEAEYPFNPLEERYKLQLFIPSNENTQKNNTQKQYSFSGVGILKEGDEMKDNNVYVSLSVLEKIIKSSYDSQGKEYKRSYSEIMVKVKDTDQIKEVEKNLENLGYSVFSLMSILDSINSTMDSMKIALGAVGGISLLVAAIGITNTMIMAISERKKEIGVMKVIGATLADIKRLFLLEAAMIGLLGGSFGIALCVGISKFISSDYFANVVLKNSEGANFAFDIPRTLIIGGLVFTTLIGVASGYFPALKAMKSSALEAIRNE